MRDMIAIVLPSGIGVRFQDLTAKQCDQVLITAAKELPADGTMMEMGQLETKHGLEAMVKQVTAGPCKVGPPAVPPDGDAFAKATEAVGKLVAAGKLYEAKAALETLIRLSTGGADPNHPDNRWAPFDPDSYDETFEDPRDHAILKRIYQERHRVDPGTVADIMGKAVTVSATT